MFVPTPGWFRSDFTFQRETGVESQTLNPEARSWQLERTAPAQSW